MSIHKRISLYYKKILPPPPPCQELRGRGRRWGGRRGRPAKFGFVRLQRFWVLGDRDAQIHTSRVYKDWLTEIQYEYSYWCVSSVGKVSQFHRSFRAMSADIEKIIIQLSPYVPYTKNTVLVYTYIHISININFKSILS